MRRDERLHDDRPCDEDENKRERAERFNTT